MNRTIKFRCKRIDNGEWLYGDLIQSNKTTATVILPVEESDMNKYILVDRETVGQFTGLLDKNGKEIYEGDIIKSEFHHSDFHREITGIVEADAVNPGFVIHYKWHGNGHDCYEYDFVQCGLVKNKVIGNIHDNPELIK